jgi:hypothetical protein
MPVISALHTNGSIRGLVPATELSIQTTTTPALSAALDPRFVNDIRVLNLSYRYKVTKLDLHALFEEFKDNGKTSKFVIKAKGGCVFVGFRTRKDALDAEAHLNGKGPWDPLLFLRWYSYEAVRHTG